MTRNLTNKERFKRYIDVNLDTGCWNWTGGKCSAGYGCFHLKGADGKYRTFSAHRVAYEMFIGPVPEGSDVLHDCDNPACVNHEHLHLGDDVINQRESVQRGRHKAKGEENNRAKLSEDDVRAIKSCPDTHVVIAKRFGVSASAISHIKAGHNWSYV
jgi:hypothetical protein